MTSVWFEPEGYRAMHRGKPAERVFSSKAAAMAWIAGREAEMERRP